MSVKKKFYTLSSKEFDEYLNDLKNSKETRNYLEFSNKSYFYAPNHELNESFRNLKNLQLEFDQLMESFSAFAKKQMIQSFLLDEIQATNEIESIYSTKHEIFSLMNRIRTVKNEKIISIVNAYKLLIESNGIKIDSLADMRKLYDKLMEDALNKNDVLDTELFRKQFVGVSNGINYIHKGLSGEENINKGMLEVLNLYNSNYEVYEKMILSHFLIEVIHPFYDGNGRFGRFIFSNGLFLETKSYFSFLISKSFLDNKSKYYDSFKNANDVHEFGCLNDFVEETLKTLKQELTTKIEDLKEKQSFINNFLNEKSLSKAEKKIISLLSEATIFSNYGISNEEIIKESQVSKRTLMYTLKKLSQENKLDDTKIGKYTFHKLK